MGTADELLALSAATLGSSGARILANELRPVWLGAACAGPARTARCGAGDNLAVHVAAATVEPGEVIVVSVDGQPALGYWGEVLTVAAQSRGAAGLVINACVRDTDALVARHFPAFSSGVALPDTAKVGPGSVDVTVTVAGAAVAPGDWVVADADGVVVVPAAELDAITERARQRAQKEAAMFAALDAGDTTINLLDLSATITAMEAP